MASKSKTRLSSLLSSIHLFLSSPTNIILLLLLGLAFFLRVYRTHDLLRFYYDQGRDALVIHDMIYTPKPVLVGPTTGLAGILRGPAFYYLLLPAYLLSSGSPIIATIWLQLINTVGLIFIYLSVKKLFNTTSALIAVFLLGFSHQIVNLSRWLSNPSPILTSVPIMLYGLIQIKDNKKPHLWWPIVALMAGLNLQFEMASEFWFIPAIILLVLFIKAYRPTRRTLLISAAVFFATLLPQIAFDFRHQHLMWTAIKQNFSSSDTSSFVFNSELIKDRLNFYLDVFSELLIPRNYLFTKILLLLSVPLFFIKKYHSSLLLLLTLLLTPLIILLFYQGNEGNFYSYYLIGTFPLFLIYISATLGFYLTRPLLSPIVLVVLYLFFQANYTLNHNFLIAGTDGPENIVFANQLQSLDWIYQDADGTPFNTDVYVPPIIPYAYDYLLLWYPTSKNLPQPQKDQVPRLYTIYEVDPIHPELLADWLIRQATIGEIEKETSFGGVHVQRRTRLQP